jgi:hypothetical protein
MIYKASRIKRFFKILENKWRRKLRDSKILLDVNSIAEFTNLAGELQNHLKVRLSLL